MQRLSTPLVLALLLGSFLAPLPVRAEQAVTTSAADDLGLYLNADQMVETASRYPKPLSQVAENVTVITSEEIEAQHAHDLGEVLRQIPGLFVTGAGQDVGSPFGFLTQGSERRHTLVLVDGVRLNLASNGSALINGLPLGIIKRIEVIKGPASSVWGSSLGGVVNILTKDTGTSERPSGQATTTVGERGTSDVNGQVAGKIGALGYYLYGGALESDGHFRNSWIDNQPLYAKLALPLSHLSLGATIGQTDPHLKDIEWAGGDLSEFLLNRSTFSTAYLDAPLGQAFNLHLAASRFDQNFDREQQSLGLGTAVGDHIWQAGELLQGDRWQEADNNFSGRLSWTGQRHSAVIGFESGRNNLDYQGNWAYWTEKWNYPAIPYTAAEERRAVFANATFNWERLTISPGVRYDFSSTSDEAISPSLGATYRLTTDTILRATVAQGFNAPNLGDLFDKRYGNPELAPERVTSVQAGVETVALAPLRLAATLFEHRITDVRVNNGVWENQGIARRHGLELEADSASWRHLSLGLKASVVSADSVDQDNDTMYAASVAARYNDPSLFTALLTGRYIWWHELDLGESPKENTFIWDLALSREVYTGDTFRAELFGVVRNLFNGAQYWDIDYQNPDRWLEAGVTVKF